MTTALERLVGAWQFTATIKGRVMVRGSATFAWLEGNAFLIGRATADAATATPEWRANFPFPTIAIIGRDDASGSYSYLYADARGVRRVYRMHLSDRTWEIAGQAGPGFFQQFKGEFSQDGNTITAHWDISDDNERWRLDFDITYTREKTGAAA